MTTKAKINFAFTRHKNPSDSLKKYCAITPRLRRGGGLIADFYSGSGTTAVACHNLGLDFIAVEKDEEYYKASVERLNIAQAQMKLF